MDGKERREQMIEMLQKEQKPISGNRFAKQLGVSRQVIVQDIALLRTAHPILATAQGYLLYKDMPKMERRAFSVRHTKEEIADELNLIVDAGGHVLNVIVEHEVYGQICADLNITNRLEAAEFCDRLKTSTAKPLAILTDGLHIHTVEAATEHELDMVEEQLKKKGYLVQNDS